MSSQSSTTTARLAEAWRQDAPTASEWYSVVYPIVPGLVPHYTFIEARALARGLSYGPDPYSWAVEGDGESLYYSHSAERHRLILSGERYSYWQWEPATVAQLESALDAGGLDAAFLAQIGLAAVLHAGRPKCVLDHLVTALGIEPRSPDRWDEARARVWTCLRLLDATEIHGRRDGHYTDPDTDDVLDLTIAEPLLQIDRIFNARVSGGTYIPQTLTLSAGPWLDRLRGNGRVLPYFTDLCYAAALPGGKVAREWTRAVWLALNQRWRQMAAGLEFPARPQADTAEPPESADYGRARLRATRYQLLTMFAPDPPVQAILAGPHPRRAREYWNAAAEQLVRLGVVHRWDEPDRDTAYPRQGWEYAWVHAVIGVEPGAEALARIKEIAAAAYAYAYDSTPKPKRKPRTGGRSQ